MNQTDIEIMQNAILPTNQSFDNAQNLEYSAMARENINENNIRINDFVLSQDGCSVIHQE